MLALWLVLLWGLSACRTAPLRPEVPLGPGAVVGAEQWEEGARALPRHSPMVLRLRPGEAIGELGALWQWLRSDARMYGEQGPLIVATLTMLWQDLVADLGADPLDTTSWQAQGIDPGRAAYVALYPPAADAGPRFVELVEGQLREHLVLDPSDDLLTALRRIRDAGQWESVRGLHAAILQRVEQIRPLSGLRLVVPMADAGRFESGLGRILEGTGYRAPEPAELQGLSLEEGARLHLNLDSPWPALLVRMRGRDAHIDVLFREFQPRAQAAARREAFRRRVLEDVIAAAGTHGQGLPVASAPPQDAALALSMAQGPVATLARLRGYIRALELLRPLGAATRDERLVSLLIQTLESARTWETAPQLNGTIYAWRPGCPHSPLPAQCLGELTMHLVGRPGLPALQPPRDAQLKGGWAGLGVGERGLGASLDTAPLYRGDWLDWTAMDRPLEIVEEFESETIDPLLFALALPRDLSLAMINLAAVLRRDIPQWTDILERAPRVRRVEFSSTGVDLRHLGAEAQWMALARLEPATSAAEREDVALAARQLLAEVLEQLAPPEAPAQSHAQILRQRPLALDQLTRVDMPEEHPLHGLRYYAHLTGEQPFLFASLGMGAEEAMGQVQALQGASSPTALTPKAAGDEAHLYTFYGRMEALALSGLLRSADLGFLEPVDVHAVLQRLGAFVFTISWEEREGVRALRYGLEVRRHEHW